MCIYILQPPYNGKVGNCWPPSPFLYSSFIIVNYLSSACGFLERVFHVKFVCLLWLLLLMLIFFCSISNKQSYNPFFFFFLWLIIDMGSTYDPDNNLLVTFNDDDKNDYICNFLSMPVVEGTMPLVLLLTTGLNKLNLTR